MAQPSEVGSSLPGTDAPAGRHVDSESTSTTDPSIVAEMEAFLGLHEATTTSDTGWKAGAGSRLPADLPGYKIVEEVGRGGMGVVYRARQITANRTVALKMILSGVFAAEPERQRFQREAEAIAQLNHPNIVTVYDVGSYDGRPYFSLEFLSGGSLAQKLAGKPLGPAEAAVLIEQLVHGLAVAHAAGIIHRDLKPANVLLAADGTPKITDFGLAKVVADASPQGGSGLTHTGTVMGTPSYMAPEQATETKDVGPAADIYAVGAILYECLTGRPPFVGDSVLATLEQVRTQEPVSPRLLQPSIPRDLETICLKCLRKERDRRYASADELDDDLRRFRERRPIRARAVSNRERLARWCQREPRLAVTLAALFSILLLTGIGGAWLLSRVAEEAEKGEAEHRNRNLTEQLRQTAERSSLQQRYFRQLEQIGSRQLVHAPGWSWRNADELDELAGLDVDINERGRDLRSRVAASIARRDFRPLEPWAPAFTPAAVLPQAGPAQRKRLDVSAVAYSPDGQLFAAAQFRAKPLSSPEIALLDARSGRQKSTLTVPNEGFSLQALSLRGIDSIRFSPDSRTLAAAERNGRIHLFDLSANPPACKSWQTHAGRHMQLEFSPDSRVLFISVTDGKLGKLQRWDIGSGVPRTTATATFTGENPWHIQFLPHGREPGQKECLFAASLDQLMFLDCTTLKPTEKPFDQGSFHACASPDGRTIAVVQNQISLVDSLSGRVVRKFRLNDRDESEYGAIDHVAFSPDGSLLATVSQTSGQVRLWDVASGAHVGASPLVCDSSCLAFHPSGTSFAVSGLTGVHAFEIAQDPNWQTLATTTWPISSFALTPDESRLVVMTKGPADDKFEILPWSFGKPSNEPEARIATMRPFCPQPMAISQDMPYRFAYARDRAIEWCEQFVPLVHKQAGAIPGLAFFGFLDRDELWIAADERSRLLSLKYGAKQATEIWNNALRYATNGRSNFHSMCLGKRYALIGLRDGAVAVIDVKKRAFRYYAELCELSIRCVALDRDEAAAFAADEKGQIYRIELATGATTKTLMTHDGVVTGMAVQANGNVISVSQDQIVKFWSFAGDLLFSIPLHRPIRQMQLSASGKDLLLLLESEHGICVVHLDQLEKRFEQLKAGLASP